MVTSEVHANAREICSFWFDGLGDEQRFAKSPALDLEITQRFGALRDRVLATGAAGWRDDPEALLAAIVLIDQFSRNIHRGSAEAFAGDPLAQLLALHAIDRGWDAAMTAEEREFLYMPLMHAEDHQLQARCVAKFGELGDPKPLDFARQHAAVIARFGRFPSRNAALGRESTPEEREYLSQPGAGW
jgi:uncharacterized protein (DUF924 family)